MKTKTYTPTSKETTDHSHQSMKKNSDNIPNILTVELVYSSLSTDSFFENPQAEEFPLPLDTVVSIGKVIEPGNPFSINIGLDAVPSINLMLNTQGNPEINGASDWFPVKGTLDKFQYGMFSDFHV